MRRTCRRFTLRTAESAPAHSGALAKVVASAAPMSGARRDAMTWRLMRTVAKGSRTVALRATAAGLTTAVVLGLGCKKEPPPPSPLAQAVQQARAAANSANQAADHAAQAGAFAAQAGGQAAQQAANANVAQAMKMLAGQNAAGGPRPEPVNFRELKALLPETLPGFKRTSATGEKAGAMGMIVSHADGEYSGDGGAHLSVKITDIGNVTGPLGLGLAGWAMVEIDRETETGYEKSTVLGGNKAFEKYDSRSKHGEVNVLVGNRFVVEVKGRDVKVEDIKAVAGKLDLAKLASLK
jgi:hypothetical protein